MTTQESKIVLVHLKQSYRENRASNYINYSSIEEAMPAIDDKSTSTLEVLSKPLRKIYLDVENIPFDKDKLIYDVITKFASFMKIPDDKYILTMNINSTQHSGLSYHIIYPYAINANDLKKAVLLFKTQNPEYENFIDASVYSSLRLFRLPNNGKVTGEGVDNNDYHRIVVGDLNSAFVQITTDLPVISGALLPDGFETFDMSAAIKDNHRTRQHRSGGFKMDEFSDAVMTEFQKLRDALELVRQQNEKLTKINDILFLKITQLEDEKK